MTYSKLVHLLTHFVKSGLDTQLLVQETVTLLDITLMVLVQLEGQVWQILNLTVLITKHTKLTVMITEHRSFQLVQLQLLLLIH